MSIYQFLSLYQMQKPSTFFFLFFCPGRTNNRLVNRGIYLAIFTMFLLADEISDIYSKYLARDKCYQQLYILWALEHA